MYILFGPFRLAMLSHVLKSNANKSRNEQSTIRVISTEFGSDFWLVRLLLVLLDLTPLWPTHLHDNRPAVADCFGCGGLPIQTLWQSRTLFLLFAFIITEILCFW